MKPLPVIQPAFAPVKILMLYLTEDCNLRCTYCFVKKTPKSMTKEMGRRVVDYYLQRNISGNLRQLSLTFFGGEPFMATEVMTEIASYAQAKAGERTIGFGATTNATLATAEVEHAIRQYGIELLVSLDGDEEAMAARPFVHGGSPYRAVARNLKRLVSWSPRVIARMTYHSECLDLRRNAERILELGAPAVAICSVAESCWRGREARLEEAYQELAEWFLAEASQGRWLPLEVEWRLLRFYHFNHAIGARPERPCSVGTSLMAVDPDGHVMPCHRYLYRKNDWLGTVEETDFPPERQQYVKLSSRDVLGCDSCHAQPICGGGCRVLALSEGLDLATGAHSGHCLVTRAQANAIRRIYETLMAEQPEQFVARLRQQQLLPADNFGELTI